MFRITNASITNATIAAFKRGVPIRMIVDASEYSNTGRVWVRYNVDRLFMAGIPLKMTKHFGQNHEKSVLFYGQGLTVWGSSNWSAGAFNYGQEHNYFSTKTIKPWFFDWFQNHFEQRWNSPQEYRAFVPIGPTAPVYKSPSNGATGISQTPTLTWDGGPWGQKFDIYLSAGVTSNPTLIASEVVTGVPDPPPNHANGTFKLSGLAPNTTYSWKIVSKTMANLTAGGPLWTFTTSGTAPKTGPTVTSVSPSSGPSTGGTSVTIIGTNFASGATVSFGLATATHVLVVNSSTITATTPSHVGGSVPVTVTNTGNSRGSLSAAFTYTSIPASTQPQLNVIVPNSGPPAGGTSVTIAGINFVPGMTVAIRGAAATITSRSTVSIQATTPPGTAGPPVDVVVTNPKGQSATLKAAFNYADPPPAPTITGISPTSGSFNGGTRLIITGTGFRYGAVMTFGGLPAPLGSGTPATTIAVTSDPIVCGSGAPLPCIIATSPAFTGGAADVVVTNLNPATGIIDSGSGTARLTAAYTFLVAPSINGVSPNSGTVSGGTQITITGANFKAGATVFVGNQQAMVSTSSTTAITAVTPASTAGTSTVTVVNPEGQRSNTLIFTYQ